MLHSQLICAFRVDPSEASSNIFLHKTWSFRWRSSNDCILCHANFNTTVFCYFLSMEIEGICCTSRCIDTFITRAHNMPLNSNFLQLQQNVANESTVVMKYETLIAFGLWGSSNLYQPFAFTSSKSKEVVNFNCSR